MLKSVLCTEGGETGVDAAVVTVSEDMSICAEWPSHTLEQLVDTGTLLVTVSDDTSICAEWPSHTLEQLVDTGTLLHDHIQIFY